MTTTQLLSVNAKIRDLVVEADDLEDFLKSMDEIADSFPQHMADLFKSGLSGGSHNDTKAVRDKYRASVPSNLAVLYREVDRLKKGLHDVRSESSFYLSYSLLSTVTLLGKFESSLTNFARDHKPESVVVLAYVSRDLHTALSSLHDASIGLIAVLNPELPEGIETAEIGFLEVELPYDLVLHVAYSINIIYKYICDVLGISDSEWPLSLRRIEQGSITVMVTGSAACITALLSLIRYFWKKIEREYTVDGRQQAVIEKGEMVKYQAEMIQALEESGVDVSSARDNISASAEQLTKEFHTLLSHAPAILVNKEKLSIPEEYKDSFLERLENRLAGQSEPRLLSPKSENPD